MSVFGKNEIERIDQEIGEKKKKKITAIDIIDLFVPGVDPNNPKIKKIVDDIEKGGQFPEPTEKDFNKKKE